MLRVLYLKEEIILIQYNIGIFKGWLIFAIKDLPMDE